MDAGLVLANSRSASKGSVRIESPGEGATLFLAPELNVQEVLLRATAAAGAQDITFRLDGAIVGSFAASDARFAYALGVGRHELQVTATFSDGSAVTTSSSFEVKAR